MDLMKRLINKLKILKKLGASGVKQSLEDEGVSFQDIEIMRVLTKKIKMKLNVKIGGCEAKNDIFFCSNLKVDSILSTKDMSKNKSLVGKKPYLFALNEVEGFDIDSKFEFDFAEYLYKKINKNG